MVWGWLAKESVISVSNFLHLAWALVWNGFPKMVRYLGIDSKYLI